MPQNGVAARPPPELGKLTSSKIAANGSGATPAKADVDLPGALADAAVAIGRGLADFAVIGVMHPETRAEGGTTLARCAQIILDAAEPPDFAKTRAEARRIIYQRHAAVFQGSELPETVLAHGVDDLIEHALTIAQAVAADERALAH